MAGTFPHLDDTQFPNVSNVDVFKYRNDFDYTRYDYSQMEIIVCNVPWDVGEARVGNRTISGIGNVVYFESKEERDNWFDSIPDEKCFRWSTKLKELHRANTIDLPLPFDIASKYNYVVVRYNLFANDESPVLYENNDGLREWFWFIREVEFLAPNTTRVHLLNDAWQTFIYDLDVTGMVLERGHAPMKATDADSYLANPISNCSNLLAPDVTADNAAYVATASGELIFNAGNMKAVVISTANPVASWGSKAGGNWRTPAGHFTLQGAPAYYAFTMNASSLNTFLFNVDAQIPQFMQTVKAVCFLNSELLDIGSAFTFCDTACNWVGANYVSNDVITLDKSKFAYPARYSDIAKLYTYPYSYIELSDANGDITEIRIETTNGKVTLDTCVNLIYPFLKINGHVSSIGKTARRNVTFANVSSRNMPIKGNWYEYLRTWDIPTFGVVQQASTRNDYDTHFDREQQRIAYTNAYDSSVASANTAQADANANADTLVANASLQAAANNATNTANNNFIVDSYIATQQLNNEKNAASGAFTEATTNNEIELKQATAAIAAVSGAASSITSAATSAVSGDPLGALNAAVSGAISAGATLAQSQAAINATSAQAEATYEYNSNNLQPANTEMEVKGDAQRDLNTANTLTQNSLLTSTAANSAATTKANAARDNATEIANAGRSRNTAQNAITNQIAQAALNAPMESGAFGYGDSATTRPVGAFANVVTMDDYSVQNVGDEFLRYGYMLNRQWDFDGDWNICEKFTYWKLSDFWVSGLSIADMYVDKLRFFLFGGVTVWRRPEYIGNTSIYDNGL